MAWHWNQQKRMAATYYAMGRSNAFITETLGISNETLNRWNESPEWNAFVEDIAERHAEVMNDLLEDAERIALATMVELTNSKDAKTRFKAAESLLNRAGKRGKPVDQVEQRSVSMTGDMNSALARALADPGVLQRLQGANVVVKALPAEVKEIKDTSAMIEEPDYEVLTYDSQAALSGREAPAKTVSPE